MQGVSKFNNPDCPALPCNAHRVQHRLDDAQQRAEELKAELAQLRQQAVHKPQPGPDDAWVEKLGQMAAKQAEAEETAARRLASLKYRYQKKLGQVVKQGQQEAAAREKEWGAKVGELQAQYGRAQHQAEEAGRRQWQEVADRVVAQHARERAEAAAAAEAAMQAAMQAAREKWEMVRWLQCVASIAHIPVLWDLPVLHACTHARDPCCPHDPMHAGWHILAKEAARCSSRLERYKKHHKHVLSLAV